MIDNGHAFQWERWKLVDSPLTGIYFRPIVYGNSICIRDFLPWLSGLMGISRIELGGIFGLVPHAWIAGEEQEFNRLREHLYRRRQRVVDLLEKAIAYMKERELRSERDRPNQTDAPIPALQGEVRSEMLSAF